MSQQWLRACELTIGTQQFTYTAATGTTEGFRIRFFIWSDWTQNTNFIDVTVTNPSRAVGLALAQQQLSNSPVELKVGYGGNAQTIFKGTIIQVRYGRESPTDTYLNITGRDGIMGYNYSKVNTTLPAQKTGSDAFDTLSQSMMQYSISPGYKSQYLSQLKFPKPLVLVGQTKDNLRTLSKALGGQWSIQQGKLTMVRSDEAATHDAVAINAGTGMVGMPEQRMQIIVVRALINPQVSILGFIKLNNGDIQAAKWDLSVGGAGTGIESGKNYWIPPPDQDGAYRVLKIEYHGDTRGNEWYMDIYCTGQNNQQVGPEYTWYNQPLTVNTGG